MIETFVDLGKSSPYRTLFIFPSNSHRKSVSPRSADHSPRNVVTIGKRTAASEYPTKGRGGKGIKTLNVAAKNGPLAGLVTVSGDEDMVVMTDTGVVIRTNVSNISQTGRSTMGVKVMRLDDDAKIMTFALVAAEEDKEEIEGEE